MVTFPNGDTIVCKVASGAWGFGARGYPEILCSPRSLRALLRVPSADRLGVLRTGFGLFMEMVLLYLGVLSPREFAFTTKTLSVRPIPGNPLWVWIRRIVGGYVNAVGLSNPGVVYWISETLPKLAKRGICPIVSLAPNAPGEIRLMIDLLHSHKWWVRAIEINPGCPNTEEGRRMFQDPMAVVEIVRAARVRLQDLGWDCPLVLKLSAAHDWRTIIVTTENDVDAFELINAVPWSSRFPGISSPLRSFGGGAVSGPAIRTIMLDIVREARKLTSVPIFACSGIDSFATAREALDAGADGLTIGTGFITNGWGLSRLPRQLAG